MTDITLSDVVCELRDQIEQAQKEAQGAAIGFDIVEAEVAIQGTVTRNADANSKAKVKFSVLGFGAEGEIGGAAGVSKASLQTVKLKLQVFDRSNPGKPVPIHTRGTDPFRTEPS